MDNGKEQNVWNCRIDTSWRITLPQSWRVANKLKIGDELVASFENGAVVLRTFDEAIKLLQEEFSDGLDSNTSLVDELLADRRKDAELEIRD